jgi:hypothetical protein
LHKQTTRPPFERVYRLRLVPRKSTSAAAGKQMTQHNRLECSLCSDEVPLIAKRLGASDSEAAWLSAIFNLEGFGGLEYNCRYSAVRVVASQLQRLRTLAGRCNGRSSARTRAA